MFNTSSPITPPGYDPPFSAVTPTDHSAWILIITSFGLSLVLFFVGLRVFIRSSSGIAYGVDDALLGSSVVFASLQSSLLLVACAKGLGKSVALIAPGALVQVQQLYYSSTLLFVVALGISKASVACMLLRLTPFQKQRWVVVLLIKLIIGWTIATVLTIGLQCNLSQPWITIDRKCPGVLLRWQITEAIGCTFEVVIVLVVAWLVWGLQMKLEKKFIVVMALGVRLPLIGFAIFRLQSFDAPGLMVDPTLLEAGFITWSQAELTYSLVAAIMPLLRPMIRNFSTYFGLGNLQSTVGLVGISGTYPNLDGGNSRAYQMERLRFPGTSEISYGTEERASLAFPNDNDSGVSATGNNRTGEHSTAGLQSMEDNDSQSMVISRDFALMV